MAATDPILLDTPAREANHDWRTYRTGGLDKAGRNIEKVYALDDNYVIYFSDCELFYEIRPRLVTSHNLGNADAALARINRLLPDNPPDSASYGYRNKFSTLELVGDAYEMIFCGEVSEGMEILTSILEKLRTTEEGKRRLIYQAGAVCVTALFWLPYFCYLWIGWLPGHWEPWILSAALAMAGGVFSVCLTIGSLEVNPNQEKLFLLSAGATRAVVAMLAGVALLLAMRAKMFAGVGYPGNPPYIGAPLTVVEMFFCFLAGFSESFVPNILRDADKKPVTGSTQTSSNPPPAGPATPAAFGQVPPNPLKPKDIPPNPLDPLATPSATTAPTLKGTGAG